MGTHELDIDTQWVHRQIACGVVFIVLGVIVVVLRLLARLFNDTARFHWDDYIILPALLSLMSISTLNCLAGRYFIDVMKLNAGYFVSPQSENYEDEAVYGISVLYPLACMFPKVSIALTFYLRMFTSATTYRYARWTSLFLVIFLVANCVAFLVPSILVWYLTSIYPYILGTWISVPNIVTDLIMLVLPVQMVCALHISRAKKAALMIVFLAGGIRLIISDRGLLGSCVRFGIAIRTFYVNTGSEETTSSSIRIGVINNMMGVIEPGMYLIAACLPPILGFLNKQGPKWVSRASSRLLESSRRTPDSSPPASSFRNDNLEAQKPTHDNASSATAVSLSASTGKQSQ